MANAAYRFFAEHLPYGSDGFRALAALLKSGFFLLLFALPLAGILTWLERRQSAMMQDRVGPSRANLGSSACS